MAKAPSTASRSPSPRVGGSPLDHDLDGHDGGSLPAAGPIAVLNANRLLGECDVAHLADLIDRGDVVRRATAADLAVQGDAEIAPTCIQPGAEGTVHELHYGLQPDGVLAAYPMAELVDLIAAGELVRIARPIDVLNAGIELPPAPALAADPAP